MIWLCRVFGHNFEPMRMHGPLMCTRCGKQP